MKRVSQESNRYMFEEANNMNVLVSFLGEWWYWIKSHENTAEKCLLQSSPKSVNLSIHFRGLWISHTFQLAFQWVSRVQSRLRLTPCIWVFLLIVVQLISQGRSPLLTIPIPHLSPSTLRKIQRGTGGCAATRISRVASVNANSFGRG